ncbi:MAG TPA: acetate/propionate family kinase [Nevskiaceae bacterium]|nr:acetate/propionate family kinase [Nevskiaceae bacterium]
MGSAPAVVVLNTGSSSVKATLFGADDVEQASISEPWESTDLESRTAQMRAVLGRLGPAGLVGHRLVHGGDRFREPVIVTPEVRDRLDALVDLAPLHMRLGLAGVDAALAARPGVPQIAVFDTAFHATLPEAAAVYAVPGEWRTRYGVRRHGFHGLSVEWTCRRIGALLASLPRRMVVCHLGSGCSVTAVLEGRSVDTTMGFTPLEGLPMATRSGSVDPGVILFLQQRHGLSAAEIEDALEHRSGLLGLSGHSADLRQVRLAAVAGDRACQLAVAHFSHALRRAVGAMTGVLGGADLLVFTGGIGENDAELRAAVASAAGAARIDPVLDRGGGDRLVSTPGSPLAVAVVRAREDQVLLAQVRRHMARQRH